MGKTLRRCWGDFRGLDEGILASFESIFETKRQMRWIPVIGWDVQFLLTADRKFWGHEDRAFWGHELVIGT